MDRVKQPWPAPHPNWYRQGTQKVFKSLLAKKELLGPVYYPDYPAPRLRVPVPRPHLLR